MFSGGVRPWPVYFGRLHCLPRAWELLVVGVGICQSCIRAKSARLEAHKGSASPNFGIGFPIR